MDLKDLTWNNSTKVFLEFYLKHLCNFSEPPGAPQNLTLNFVDQSTVILSWSPPLEEGGRNDTLYRVKCEGCGISVSYIPNTVIESTPVNLSFSFLILRIFRTCLMTRKWRWRGWAPSRPTNCWCLRRTVSAVWQGQTANLRKCPSPPKPVSRMSLKMLKVRKIDRGPLFFPLPYESPPGRLRKWM